MYKYILSFFLILFCYKTFNNLSNPIRDILIRFASKDFTLDDFHESIHLCNTTVQLKYRKLPRCNSDLPEQRHWNLQNFRDYLQYLLHFLLQGIGKFNQSTNYRFRSRGQELAWEKIIRPGIKQNLIGALLASQDNMVNRKNSFQLYGADFVVADDFSVWLLEINKNPRLHPPSSEVTVKLYPEVIEDAMKGMLIKEMKIYIMLKSYIIIHKVTL